MKRLVSLAWTALLGSSILFPATATAEVVTQTLAFEAECLDLEGGTIQNSCLDPSSDPASWDILVAYHADRTFHAVIFQNQVNDVEIAYLENTTFEAVTAADIASATFTKDVLDPPCDRTSVALIRTDLGSVYKLGNGSEDENGFSFDYELLLPVS